MRYLFFLLLVVSVSGNAAPISVVNKLWLQPKDFAGVTWANVSGICDPVSGLCNGSILGQDVTGWYWAGIDEMNQLFNHYLANIYPTVGELGPGPGFINGLYELDPLLPAILPFFDDFETTSAPGSAYFITSGLTRYQNDSLVYSGTFAASTFPILLDLFYFEASTYNQYLFAPYGDTTSITEPGRGLWLYKPEVPAPATLWLVGLALAGLRWMPRKARMQLERQPGSHPAQRKVATDARIISQAEDCSMFL